VDRHERNATEKAIILAFAFRAGLASRPDVQFLVEPATRYLDHHLGFDLVLYRIRGGATQRLLVDATSSFREKGKKIARTIEKGRGFRFIVKGDWQTAAFDIILDPCFERAWGQLSDGKPMALPRVCPDHGNSCRLARHLFDFGERLNRQLENHRRRDGSPGQATEFSMSVSRPSF